VLTEPSCIDNRGGHASIGPATVHVRGQTAERGLIAISARENDMNQIVLVHELGHNFGSHHANGIQLANVPFYIRDLGQSQEYGDDHDIMGAGFREYSILRKFKFGWHDNLPLVQEEKSYSMMALGSDAAVQGYELRLNEPENRSYYIELRFLDSLPAVQIRLGPQSTSPIGWTTWLPQRVGAGSNPFVLKNSGETFEDRINGFLITLEEINSSRASFRFQRIQSNQELDFLTLDYLDLASGPNCARILHGRFHSRASDAES
jgi:hypothetical protein